MHYVIHLGSLSSKFQLLFFTWFLALLLSLVLKIWGYQHPEPFIIRSFIVWGLLFGPSIFLSCYLLIIQLRKSEV